MEREIQNDLFDQLNKTRNRRRFRPSFRKLFPYGFVNFRLSYEGAVFSLIVFLMLCVVMYSIGMERGRSLKQYSTEEVKKEVQPVRAKPQTKAVEPAGVSVAAPKPSPVPYKATKNVEVKSAQESAKNNYTIQVLTYRDRSVAEKQVQRLAQNGYRPFVIFSSGFYQICVGRYPNRESAKADLTNLRKSYKDCFVRDIQRD